LNLDPELEELFPSGADREVVELIRALRPAAPPLDPYFRNHLRMKLTAEARRTRSSRPPGQWFSWPRSPLLAVVAAACAVVLTVGVYNALHQAPPPVAVIQPGTGQIRTAEPIKIAFTGPVDKNAVAQSVVIEPATLYTTRWDGQTLVIIPLHALASNTSYTVKLVPQTASTPNTPAATPAPPVVVRFVTTPAAVSPVLPPSYRSDNLTFFGEISIADPGAVTSAIWTPDGQALIVTRTVAESASSGALPPAATLPQVVPEIWSMTPQGTLVRRLAARATLPALAPDGRHLAFWRQDRPDQSGLWVSTFDDDGSHAIQVATVGGVPNRPATWVGSDRLAYDDGGTLRLVDLQGNPPPLTIAITPGASAAAINDGRFLATATADGATLFDVASGQSKVVSAGVATAFAWSPDGRLAFILSTAAGPQLWVAAPDGLKQIAASTTGDRWSDISWSPDSSSLLVASRGASADAQPSAFFVNADGSGKPVPFPAQDREYTTPRWSPDGSSIVFLRGDETGRARLWIATVRIGQLSPADAAQLDAVHVVTRFLDARQSGNLADAQADLGPQALATYQNGNLPLVAAPGDPFFARTYVFGVQLVSPDQFLVTVRIVLADPKTRQEIRFFEEHLTVVRHDQRFIIDAVQAGVTTILGQGPSVVSVQVQPVPPRQQVTVKFDADLAAATVSRDSIYLRDSAGQRIDPTDFQFDPNTRTVTIMAKLPKGSYTLVVTTAVTDINGRSAAQEYDYTVVISAGND
jgi:Big-like domain-containing protein/WD40 repeat protein